ncbi:MAG: HDOD domain-containing protein [bacterium]|nr:HDOD domain-containing protein [bacterium]
MNAPVKKTFVSDLVEEMGSLPTVAAQIVSLTSQTNCDIGALTRVILSDNVMSMRFLALANSAAVSRGNEVKNLRMALVRLGLRRVRNVALCMGMHDMMPGSEAEGRLNMTEFWKFNLATASCAQGLAFQRGTASDDDAWLVGILHSIGVSSLDQKASSDLQTVLEEAQQKSISLIQAEINCLDFHHGELGGRLLSNWNLPQTFCDAVEFSGESFQQDEITEETRNLISILRDSIKLVRSIGYGANGDGTAPLNLDQATQELGIEEPALLGLAAKVDREVTDMSRLIGIDLPDNLFQETIRESRKQVVRLGMEGFKDSLARENLEEEMSMAREIQQRLLPKNTPEMDCYDLWAANHPSLHVSGDYYDFFKIKGGKTAFVIADVSGKGLPAAMLASNLQASLRALAQVFDDPGELLGAVNTALHESTDSEKFATLFLGVLSPDGKGLRYASAGHNPPLLLRETGVSEWLKPAGTPLGMFPEMKYPVMDIELCSGDLFVSYTDGITEAVDQNDVEFEEEGLEKTVRNNHEASGDIIIERVIEKVLIHVSTNSLNGRDSLLDNWDEPDHQNAGDDLTMVVIRSV